MYVWLFTYLFTRACTCTCMPLVYAGNLLFFYMYTTIYIAGQWQKLLKQPAKQKKNKKC